MLTPVGRPQTRYVETPLGYLAFQVFGAGERDIMFVTNALSNGDAIWDEPSAVRFFDRLSTMGRVIRYDMRGSGVSDPIPGRTMWLPLEGNMDDVRAVLDAAGSERAVVYGDTEGGLWSLMLAASVPERVEALILVNTFPRLMRAEDYPIGMPAEVADRLAAGYIEQHGRTGALLDMTAPSTAGDARFHSWFTRYQRLSIPLGLVVSTFEWYRDLDVRSILPLIRVPTLVVARRDAIFHRATFSEYIAEHIEGAELRILDGTDTLPFHAGEFGPVLDAVEDFLTGRRESVRSDRVLATVMFTDIVDSTSRAAAMGDERWLDLLAEHDRIVRAQLERFRGTEVRMTGDGCIATFDGPARAVTCATAISRELSAIGLPIRIGIHTGEVEMRSGQIGGLGVHIASRVMDQAEIGGVLVSATVKDLVVGSGIDFERCGTFDLKGVPGTWDLFTVGQRAA